ncbi:MAG: ABC transporter substrate-binding protein [Sedimenticola sp.]
MNKRLAIFSVILIGVLVAAWLLLPLWDRHENDESATHSDPPEKLVIAAYKGDFSALIWIADTQNYFKHNGLDVRIEEYDSGITPVQNVIEGKADIATSGEFVAVNNLFHHNDLTILSTIALGDAIELVSKLDAGIKTPSDLKGKRIGLKMGSQAEYELNHFLLKNKLSIDDVQTIDINPLQMEEAILTGDIDAVVVWNPFAFQINGVLGENVVSWDVQDFPFFFLTIAKQEMLQARPSVVKKFLASMNEAASFVRNHNNEARRIVRDRLGYEDSYSQKSWNTLDFKFGLSQTLLLAMESEARWLLRTKNMTHVHVPNYMEHFAITPLKAINPAAVELIH